MSPHGGDVWQVAAEAGIAAEDLLDFSANVNPLGLPSGARQRLAADAANPRRLGLYPDPAARTLRLALSRHLGVPAEAIVAGPGAAALLNPALRCCSTQRALVPIPAFGEYRRVCSQRGVEFVPYWLDRVNCFRLPVAEFCRVLEEVRPGVAVVNNPHNPSGALLTPEQVRRIVESAQDVGASVVLDEAFIDYTPDGSRAADAAENPGLIVIRSLTKFYGCAALRAGYAVAHPDTIRRIVSFQPAWPITQLAIDTFAEAIADHEYAAAAIRENAAEREMLASELRKLGLVVFPSAANFLLSELSSPRPSVSELRHRLIRRHAILIRNCDSYEGLAAGRYLRVAVRTEPENLRLVHALAEELGSQ
jgi:threonine-phosphate decarboxylase